MKFPMFLLTSTRLSQSVMWIKIWTTCSLTFTTDGENPPVPGYLRLRKLITRRPSRRESTLITTITIRELNLMLNGLRNRSSLMLPIVSVIPSWEKSPLKKFLALNVHQPIPAISSSHSSRPPQWTPILLLLFSRVRSSMRIRELLNGSDSGRSLLQPHSPRGPHSTHLKFMLVMVHHLLVGWPKTGTSGRSLNNSRMVQVGVLRILDIVTIMSTWMFNMVLSVPLPDQLTHSICSQFLPSCKTSTLITFPRWFTTRIKI